MSSGVDTQVERLRTFVSGGGNDEDEPIEVGDFRLQGRHEGDLQQVLDAITEQHNLSKGEN